MAAGQRPAGYRGHTAALVDVSDTEWRPVLETSPTFSRKAALVDVSDTEWRHELGLDDYSGA